MSRVDNRSVGKRLSTWRRLMLSFGPPSAKQVGLTLAEFAWLDQDDPDADLIVRHCTQKILCRLCDYKNPRGLQLQLTKLEDSGWVERDKVQTGRGTYREYTLLMPDSVPRDAIVELTTPSTGMWNRVLEPFTERTGESEFARCQATLTPKKPDQANSSARSGELQRTIRRTPAHDQANLSSPLYKSLRSFKKVLKEGSPTSGSPKAEPPKIKQKKQDLQHVSESLPDWQHYRSAARRKLNLKDNAEEKPGE